MINHAKGLMSIKNKSYLPVSSTLAMRGPPNFILTTHNSKAKVL